MINKKILFAHLFLLLAGQQAHAASAGATENPLKKAAESVGSKDDTRRAKVEAAKKALDYLAGEHKIVLNQEDLQIAISFNQQRKALKPLVGGKVSSLELLQGLQESAEVGTSYQKAAVEVGLVDEEGNPISPEAMAKLARNKTELMQALQHLKDKDGKPLSPEMKEHLLANQEKLSQAFNRLIEEREKESEKKNFDGMLMTLCLSVPGTIIAQKLGGHQLKQALNNPSGALLSVLSPDNIIAKQLVDSAIAKATNAACGQNPIAQVAITTGINATVNNLQYRASSQRFDVQRKIGALSPLATEPTVNDETKREAAYLMQAYESGHLKPNPQKCYEPTLKDHALITAGTVGSAAIDLIPLPEKDPALKVGETVIVSQNMMLRAAQETGKSTIEGFVAANLSSNRQSLISGYTPIQNPSKKDIAATFAAHAAQETGYNAVCQAAHKIANKSEYLAFLKQFFPKDASPKDINQAALRIGTIWTLRWCTKSCWDRLTRTTIAHGISAIYTLCTR